MNNITAPSVSTENIDSITVFVDPATHTSTDILPTPNSGTPGVIWIGGERIEYKSKVSSSTPNTWVLGLIRRGTNGTTPTAHSSTISSAHSPYSTVANKVFIELSNQMSITAGYDMWVNSAGGLWYSNTSEATFIKESLGSAIL